MRTTRDLGLNEMRVIGRPAGGYLYTLRPSLGYEILVQWDQGADR